ncbi:single-stranded DNA-binding protein, partial [Streptococcus pyogenes]
GYGSSSATSTPNFAREESPFGGNPMDISDDDLPF